MTRIIEVVNNTVKETDTKREYLEFKFDNTIRIDLTSDDSNQLKELFVELLKEFNKGKFDLVYKNESGRSDLFAEVSEKYIKDLNSELMGLYTQFPVKKHEVNPE